jgi:hypothetical protein
MSPKQVQVANGELIMADKKVLSLEWWIQGHTFYTEMMVLDLGPFDVILGYDWLKPHSPMTCHWGDKTIAFEYGGQNICLQGVHSSQLNLEEISSDKLVKAIAGNDVGVFAIVEVSDSPTLEPVPAAVQDILQEFADVFEDPKVLPPPRFHDHHIPLLPNSVPVNAKSYRYSPLHKDDIEKQVKALLQAGMIIPSTSPFASPVLLVQKKDGTWRFCVDYRKLNSITVKNRYPMPVIDEILDELTGTKYFAKLDMRSGYHQVRMHPPDEYKTAFKTHHGHYQFRVMPFGLTNAPATFQCIMNEILEPFLRKFVLVFLDDILIYSPTFEQHIVHLQLVLAKLREHQLYMKLSKCSFAQTSLEYLGHIISHEGVSTDPAKTAAMSNWPVPTNVTELRGFLGLTGYYRKFIKHYGIIARPLTNLLKHKQFTWSTAAQQAFEQLKAAMVTAPVLAIPDFQ